MVPSIKCILLFYVEHPNGNGSDTGKCFYAHEIEYYSKSYISNSEYLQID